MKLPSNDPGAKAFTIWRRKLLFILRDDKPDISHPNVWSLPGGAIEPGETHEQAFLREFEEELGLRPRAWRYLGRHDQPGFPLVHRYLVRLDETEAAALRLGNEGQRFEFFTPDQIAGLKTSPRLQRYLGSIAPHLKAIVEDGAEPDPAKLGLS